MSYTPPDAHSVNLNFETPLTPVDSHNLILNFGETAQRNALQAPLKTGFHAVISGSNTEIIVNHGQLSADFKTAIQAQINGTNFELVDNRGILQTSIKTSMQASVIADNDINHILGVSIRLGMQFKRAIASLSVVEIPWSKPVLRVSNEALFYEQSLVLSSQVDIWFEQAGSLNSVVRSMCEQATGLSSDAYLVWERGDRRFIHQRYVHQDTIKLRYNRESKWQEMIRRRKQFTYSHEVAEQFEKHFSLEWDKGLEIITKSDLPWDKAKSIHYRKHPVQPWPKPVLPEYVGDGNLNFICLCTEVDAHNVILNFGADDCIPALSNRNWWYIVNNLSAERLDNGEPIKVINGTYNGGRSTWCWSYSITVAHTEKEKLQPIDDQPVILKLMINGFEHHVLLETETETIKFANKSYTYDGRSVTALNAADYAAKRSFIQDNERTSVQLVQAEIDRAQSGTELDWKLIDDVGWIIATESLSYAELAPMDAIKQVVEAGGGFIYSQKSGNTLSILPRYKKGYWDAMTVDDYNVLIPQSIVIQQTIEQNKDYIADYNAINVVNSRSGNSLTVKQRDTAGDIPLEAVTGPMFDVVSGASFGKMELIKANIQEFHTLSGLPVSQDIGEILPGKTVAFHGQWWGVIDSVSGSFSHGKVTESIKVERIHRE